MNMLNKKSKSSSNKPFYL